MNSLELYEKLKPFSGIFNYGQEKMYPAQRGTRWCWTTGKGLRWHYMRWMPSVTMEANGRGYVRPTYSQFCFAMGLEMMP